MNIMRLDRLRYFVFVLLFCLSGQLAAQLQHPKEFFGFTPGDDRQMFLYEPMMKYLKQISDATPMVHIEQFGETWMGRPMYIVFVSSAENIANLDRLKEINRKLALDDFGPGETAESLSQEGRVFFLSTLSMHANEVGPIQALPLMVWELIEGTDPRTSAILNNTVSMFIPHNPDGMNMIVEHYNKHKGTALETSNMPGVYHKYVGHNINRDFVTLTQKENQMVAAVYSTQWYPQAMVERHQMWSTGPRFYISPPHDPIAENVDPGIWNWMRVYGSRTLTEMTNAGLPSVSVNYLFDDYWPGATTTSIWKGVIGMLSEAASVNIATPIYVEPNEIRPIGKGLGEYAISINLPVPWEGGWWRLGDIVRYELENTFSYLHTSAIHRSEILKFRNEISRREIQRGRSEPPFYYIIPLKQHDPGEMAAMVNLLDEHGVKTWQLKEDLVWNRQNFSAGDVVVPLSQPYRAFIKEVLERQKFPARHYTPGGEMIRPYDITSWSLPLHRAVEVVEINHNPSVFEGKIEPLILPFHLRQGSHEGKSWAVYSSASNESYKAVFRALREGIRVERIEEPFTLDDIGFPAGSFLIQISRNFDKIGEGLLTDPLYLDQKPEQTGRVLQTPRIGLVETWAHDMNGGWTRYIFDQYQIPYKVLRPDDLQTASLSRDFDVLFFTDRAKSVFMTGKFEAEGSAVPSRYPPEFAKGMEKKGFDNLMNFVEKGGKVMAWGPSTELFLGTLTIGEGSSASQFQLPVNNIGARLTSSGLYVPGSLLRVNVRQNHPLTWGLPSELGVFHRGTPVFRTSIPWGDMDRRVIMSFASDNILMSGYAEKEELLKNEAALVWLKKGKGQIILSSFNPQFRASTTATYKLMFNAILLPD